jgi:serine/threonine protein kinase/tetratricopeptide (TPR) repeat protein
MKKSDGIDDSTSKIGFKSIDKAIVKIHNIIPTMERTFLRIGSTIGKYTIIEEIDRGGMAVVYKALQHDLDREVALKVLPANITINRRFVERFLSEAHAVAKLQHPYIVNIHEVAVENGVYYLAMDYIPGMNLYYHLNFQKPKLVDVLEIAIRLADALAYAHRQRIIHRDLKLNNIIMRDNITPVLIDFGLAKALESEEVSLTKTGEILGSPAYMAPERLLGANSDARSDICSLGIMLYEMLTFKNPYLDPRSMPQTTRNVMEATPILPRKIVPWLPVEIEAITLKAMHKEPDKRYQTMEEFRDDLKRYQKGEPVIANPPSIWSKGRHFWHVYWSLLVIGLLLVTFSTFFVLFMYWDKKREQPYWHLSYQEKFERGNTGKDWALYPAAGGDSPSWRIGQKALYSPPAGAAFIRLERPFSRDVRIEFDVLAAGGNLSNAGFFLGGCPDSGYCFHIHKGPSAQCGISFPASDFIFSDIDPFELPASDRYHVAVEKIDYALTLTVSGKTVATIRDYLPAGGKSRRSMGFFSDGAECCFDNVKVYTYQVPSIRGPFALADGFLQRGHIESALDEYEELLPEFISSRFAGDLLLKICDCRIRLGRYGDASKALALFKDSVTLGHNLFPERLFLEGMIYRQTGRRAPADSSFARLLKIAPESPFSQAALAVIAVEAAEEIKRDELPLAEGSMAFIRADLVGNRKACGRVFLMIMERYLEKGEVEKAKRIGTMLLSAFGQEPDIRLRIRAALARAHLANGNKASAIDLLNQCISTLPPTEAAWQAWLTLAEVYEYEANFPDAYTIYKKVYDECPHCFLVAWIARIRMGEIADQVTSEERSKNIFSSVAAGSHPFVLPRRIAQFYTDDLSHEQFKEFWLSMHPGNKAYYRYYAKKAVMEENSAQAVKYFELFQQSIAPNTWAALQIHKALSSIQK